MKPIERIVYITFWINIFVVIFTFIGLPILFIKIPGFIDAWIANNGKNILNITYGILCLAVFFHWIYCLRFLFKYDRYSKSLLPLIFLNVIYAPIYYYRVKIKKRPLWNKIIKPQENTDVDNTISEKEFIE